MPQGSGSTGDEHAHADSWRLRRHEASLASHNMPSVQEVEAALAISQRLSSAASNAPSQVPSLPSSSTNLRNQLL